jgi:putative tryptophan/tyrosine transport system substrate-binding protein
MCPRRYLASQSDNPKSKIENQKWAGLFAIVVALTACWAGAEAQQPAKVHRVGYLSAIPLSAMSERLEAFRQGLRELGYVEGKDVVIERRSAEGKEERVLTLAAELVSLKVEVIVTGGPGATRPAKEATSTIPIVIAQDPDPVANGFVASLARPGGNITGLSILAPELSGKRLELLKETVHKLSRVAVFGTSNRPGEAQMLRETELAAATLKVKLQYIDVLSPKDLKIAFRSATEGRSDAAIIMMSGPVALASRGEIAELAAKHRLPSIYTLRDYVEAGGLMTYGVSFLDLHRRAATYVDKILKGAKPADLPVEQPTKFELVINLKAAKQIGLTVPPNVLARADKVIR